ncbi:MAG TPA: mannonate dehydratase [Dysgonamonadaceae bacterium]|nr:mannonate dehydratase [Dysgonamonadaceae bacterium]
MEKTWRWFGKKDPITLDMLRQIGVEGIVTSLYDVPNNEVWQTEDILDLKKFIEAAGLRWSVVESVPVSESIKYGGKDRDLLIENYKQTLKNLGKAGITTVCYNFMPVIDWVRTDLHKTLPDGTQTLYFDKIKFAYFDCKILKRKEAEKDYSQEEMQQVNELENVITEAEKAELIDTIIVKTQGFINRSIVHGNEDPVEAFKNLLRLYEDVDKGKLRENLKYFLQQVIPVAEKNGMRLCIHPDDPPFPVFGLPRIVSNEDDIRWILELVESPANGFTFCAGSLSAGIQNEVVDLAKKFAKKSFFVHLRSTEIMENGDFVEASHLGGRANLIELIRIFEKENPNVPMRVDHGKLMLDDVAKNYNPGYSFLGRMFALAQVEGMMAVVRNEMKSNLMN